MGYTPVGPIYTASFAAVSMTTNPADVFGILASTLSRVRVISVELGAQSSAPVAQMLGVQVWRGSTASSTSAAITPTNIEGHTGALSAGSSVTQPSSGIVSTTSAVSLFANSWHLDDQNWKWEPCQSPILEKSQRMHVRVTAPSTTTSIYGTLTFEEMGKIPG
jgi:hypothetical protein